MRTHGSIRAVLPLLVGLVATFGTGTVAEGSWYQPSPDATVARPSVPDTLRHSVSADDALIVALPPQRDSVAVDRYELIDGPALSGVVGRSFAWVTHSAPSGRHTVLLHPIPSPPQRDTLVMIVTVR